MLFSGLRRWRTAVRSESVTIGRSGTSEELRGATPRVSESARLPLAPELPTIALWRSEAAASLASVLQAASHAYYQEFARNPRTVQLEVFLTDGEAPFYPFGRSLDEDHDSLGVCASILGGAFQYRVDDDVTRPSSRRRGV